MEVEKEEEGEEEELLIRQRVRWDENEEVIVTPPTTSTVKTKTKIVEESLKSMKINIAKPIDATESDPIWKGLFSQISQSLYSIGNDDSNTDDQRLYVGSGVVVAIFVLVYILRWCFRRRNQHSPIRSTTSTTPTLKYDEIRQSEHFSTLSNDPNITHNINELIQNVMNCRQFVDTITQYISDNDWVSSEIITKHRLQYLRESFSKLKTNLDQMIIITEKKINNCNNLIEKKYLIELQFLLFKLKHSLSKYELIDHIAQTYDVFFIEECHNTLKKKLIEIDQLHTKTEDIDDYTMEVLLCNSDLLQRYPARPQEVEELIEKAKNLVENHYRQKKLVITMKYEKKRHDNERVYQGMKTVLIDNGNSGNNPQILNTPVGNVRTLTNGAPSTPFYQNPTSTGSNSSLDSVATVDTAISMIATTPRRTESTMSDVLQLCNHMKSTNDTLEHYEEQEKDKIDNQLRELKSKSKRSADEIYKQHNEKQNKARTDRSHLDSQTSIHTSNLENNYNNQINDINNLINNKQQYLITIQYGLFIFIAGLIAITFFMRITGCMISLSQHPMDSLGQCWWNTSDLICSMFERDSNKLPDTVKTIQTKGEVFIDIFSSQVTKERVTNLIGKSVNGRGKSGVVDSVMSLMNSISSVSIGSTNDYLMYPLVETLKGIFPSIGDPLTMFRYRCLFSIIGRCILVLIPSVVLSLVGLWSLSSYISPLILLYFFFDIIILLWKDIMRPMIKLQAIHWSVYLVMCCIDKVSWSTMKIITLTFMYVVCVTIACFYI